jgi:hypothetical protein
MLYCNCAIWSENIVNVVLSKYVRQTLKQGMTLYFVDG